jgi:two-component system, cell cycle sensor histidine kinase and response regulator CckA
LASELPSFFTMPGDWRPTAASYAVLTVEDNGCGISGEDMEQIFDPFFSTKFVGRGLGLAVVLGLVKAWEGTIGVLSQKDQGSIFRIVLPLCSSHDTPVTEDLR